MIFLKRSLLLFGLILFFPMVAQANGEIGITKNILDLESSAGGIFEEEVVIRNDASDKRDLYVIVRDIVGGGEKEYKDPSELPMISSLTRWIEISRGVIELFPGDEKTLPLKINIPSDAVPGVYHAAITFARGSNRPIAEKAAMEKNEVKLIINLEVKKHEIERAEVSKFSTKGSIVTGTPVNFLVEIKNLGNKEIIPEGEIIIYDKGGRIVDSIQVANPRETIYPSSKGDAKNLYEVNWQSKVRFGRFKAKLMMYYGEDKKDLQDVITFVLMPLPLLIILGMFIVFLVAFLSFMLLKRNIVKDEYENESDLVFEQAPVATARTETRPSLDPKGNYVIDLKSRR